jgi:hypothetical protein
MESPDRTPISAGVFNESAGEYGLPKNPIPDGADDGRMDVRVSFPCCGTDAMLLFPYYK